jgi:alkylation response protein AidB-like acyl-CoA dehydrogenase
MKLDFNPEDEAFRLEVRAFLRDKLPADIRAKVEGGQRFERDDFLRWSRALAERGWLTPAWPVEEGGQSWTPVQRLIFDNEMLAGGAPRNVNSGINMLGPVLIAFGTPEQKARYLDPIRRSEVWWAQGFSEPEAGSDLASMRTRAVLEGDEFILNGHKVWTSFAQFSDMMFALVRTDPDCKPQEGISFLLLDLKSPGVTVRPIRGIDGGTDLNEVILENVRVPRDNLIGEINKGWTYAKFLLGHERTGIAGVPASKQQLARLRALAQGERRRGVPMLQDPVFAARLAAVEIDLIALEHTVLRMLTERHGKPPGVESSMLKVRGTEIRQQIYELLVEVAGPKAIAFVEEALVIDGASEPGVEHATAVVANYLDSRKLSIFGGSNEVQRNVVAKAVLGL